MGFRRSTPVCALPAGRFTGVNHSFAFDIGSPQGKSHRADDRHLILGSVEAAEYSLREMWLYENKMIIVLNDDDIEQMLLEKKNANDPARILLKKIEDFRLSV